MSEQPVSREQFERDWDEAHQPQGKAQPETGTREAKPSAQFDWYWRSNPSNFEQVTTLDGQMILAWHAWCAALYLNGEVQRATTGED